MDRKKVVVISVSVGAVALIVAAVIIFGGILANRPQPVTQPPIVAPQSETYHAQQTEPATAAPIVVNTHPPTGSGDCCTNTSPGRDNSATCTAA